MPNAMKPVTGTFVPQQNDRLAQIFAKARAGADAFAKQKLAVGGKVAPGFTATPADAQRLKVAVGSQFDRAKQQAVLQERAGIKTGRSLPTPPRIAPVPIGKAPIIKRDNKFTVQPVGPAKPIPNPRPMPGAPGGKVRVQI